MENKTGRHKAIMRKIIFCILCIFLLSACAKKEEITVTEEVPELEQKIIQFKLCNYKEDGSKKWELKGDSADVMSDVIYLTDIIVDMYDKTPVRFKSDDGWYNKGNQIAFLDKNVLLTTPDGFELTTDAVEWDGKTEIVSTSSFVNVKRSDVLARGTGAKAFPQMRQVMLKKDVEVKLLRGIINVGFDESDDAQDKETKATITCDGPMEIDYDNNIAIFKNNVKVEDDRGKMLSEFMQAHLDPESKDILKVVAEGEVRVMRGKDCTYSQKAIYDTTNQKIIFLGSSEIYIHPDEDTDEYDIEDMTW